MYACMQIVATLVKLLVHDMIGYICSNYVSIQVHIIQMTSLIQHSNYLLQEPECVAHVNARSHHLHLLCQFIIGLLQHKMCLHPQCPTYRFMDSASTWLVTCMLVYCTDLHACMYFTYM